ncbi:MAG: hypothetical protein LBT13_01230 [Treponema sp.]|jgi:hypothetical protein|nr:hypothetical protein [Treponema sp.]
MVQIYFMSILFNGVAAYILIRDPGKPERQGAFYNDTNRLVIGVLTLVTGLLKLLSTVQGDVPVLGDIFPASAGLAAGFMLIFEYYRKKSTMDSETARKIEGFLNFNKKWIGFLVLGSAALHFLFPQALLL